MVEPVSQPALQQISRPLNLIPVGLKEAALDSPTFRATAVHFSEQVEIIERWLEAYIKSTSKLVHDVAAFEETINAFLTRSVPPANISEAVLDHDYTLLAMRRLAEGSREWWLQFIGCGKKMEATLVEPIRNFMFGELRNFKDARRYLEQSQRHFDNALARYLGQSKTKEPSALREDAFQVHEARKAYLKASLDFCLLAPQLRFTVDRLLVRTSAEQLKEMKKLRESSCDTFSKWDSEVDRLRGWSREMEAGEGVFRRELQMARREIAETAGAAFRPSRELEDYNASTVAFLGSKGPSMNTQNMPRIEKSEKRGWLFLRTISGKPARTLWVRRWFYIKSGIFGWLVQGIQSGGVEESEKIGVLLCNVKPAVQEERRFCFEVKTKNSTLLLQAETQSQLMEWLDVFEMAKNKALEASTSNDHPSYLGGVDPAFAITQPIVSEFAAKSNEGHAPSGSDDMVAGAFDRANTLPIPGLDGGTLASRSSFDVSNTRRSIINREDGESSRDHASRIIQKLDIHRKSNTGIHSDSNLGSATASPIGGIASLISASHNILPVYTPMISQMTPVTPKASTWTVPPLNRSQSTLAPSTLANPPAPTNLSKAAVIISGERGVGIGRSDAAGGMPSGIMANLWGSSNWGYVNRLEREPLSPVPGLANLRLTDSASKTTSDENKKPESSNLPQATASISANIDLLSSVLTPTTLHRKALSADADAPHLLSHITSKPEDFPPNYPMELKIQEAQFRILFPNVSRDEKLLLVFRATWNPNEQQEFPGRVYVTMEEIYFYSHHLGLVLISSVKLENIEEVTAAPGKDCDFIFLHLREGASKDGSTRITIKIFLEPLRLLQTRLNFLVDSVDSDMTLESIIAQLIRMETEDPTRSPSMESWEDISVNTPIDDGTTSGRQKESDLRAKIHVERGFQLGRASKEITKFHLPSHPVVYEPQDMQRKAAERDFDISPKALFHVLFGDKSAVFQLLYHERSAQRISQGPWIYLDEDHRKRDFHFQIEYVDMFRRHRQANVVDHQVIEVLDDHICYVVAHKKTPWNLPHHEDFMLVTKIVITHLAKAKCRLIIYSKVEWSKAPAFSRRLVERQALNDLDRDAVDLMDVISDQARKLGPQSRTKKAIYIFGHVGKQTSISLFAAGESGLSKRSQIKQRTLTSMVLETTNSFAKSVASSLMMWAFGALKAIWSVGSANGIILSILALSMLTNLFLSGKDTSEWWNERRAANFMNRIGVGPNIMMSKAVYLKDLDEVFTGSLAEMSGRPGSKCYSTFLGIVNTTDMDAPFQNSAASFLENAKRSTARRLRRARQHLGSYRHDLLVALRLVNNVEREVMRAEWENWLLDENIRCKHVQMMLQESRSGVGASKMVSSSDSRISMDIKEEKLETFRRWHEEYCGSCKREQDLLVQGNGDPTSI